MLFIATELRPAEIADEIERRFSPMYLGDQGLRPEDVTAIVTTGSAGVTRDTIDRFPGLRLVAVYGVGTDRLPLDTLRERGVQVATTPGALTDAVAEHAVALMLALCRRIAEGDRFVRLGQWSKGPLGISRGLKGRTLGIYGYGRIGRCIDALARGFGMRVVYTDLNQAPENPEACRPTLIELAREADVLVICVAAAAGTVGSVDAAVLATLGSDGLLVNVARGSIVREADLVDALARGVIAGAALDVFEAEPKPHPGLLELSNVVLTPHIASATIEARRAMGRMLIENLEAFFHGAEMPNILKLGS